MTRKQVVTAVILTSGVAVMAVLFSPSLLYRMEENEYRVIFMKLPRVKSVRDYLNYEGRRMAELDLRDGGFLSIDRFDESVFVDTNFIGLLRIGDLRLRCGSQAGKYDGLAEGINIIQFMRLSSANPDVRNIEDVTSNYATVYNYVQHSVPDVNYPSVKVLVGKNYYWCNTIRTTDR